MTEKEEVITKQISEDNNKKISIKKLFEGIAKKKNTEESVREAIEELIEEEGDKGQISLHEHMLLSNILDLKETKAESVMTPRADIVTVDESLDIKELASIMIDKGFSRIPVFKNNLDDIVGIVHVKNILEALIGNKKPTIRDIMNPDVIFVSPAMKVLDLLKEMQIKRNHMVFVVDEYGGIDGLVTIEDLVEEIVGDIEDEYDLEKQAELSLNDNNTIEADARAKLDELENMIGYFLTDDERSDQDIDTVGGLVFQLAGRIPLRGEIIPHSSGVQFRVGEVDPRKIRHVTIFNLPDDNLKKEPEPQDDEKQA